MATENRGVMVYLAPELEQYITEYCTENNITRKDKDGNITPSLGTGIVTYLKSTILGISPNDILSKASSKIPSTGLTTAEVLDLIKESITSQVSSEGLSKDDVVTLIEESVKSKIPSTVFNIPSEEVFNTLLATAIDTSIAPLERSIERLESELLELKKPLANAQAHPQGGRVVTTTDSIAIATTPPPKKNPPTSKAQKGEGKGLTMAELVEKLGKTRQAIESARDKGTLGEFGFHAEKNGRNWLYWEADEER